MLKTMLLPAPASLGVLASLAPAATRGSALASVRFQTVTAWPDLLTRLVATAEPMAPRPMKPISTFDTPCDVLIRNRLPSPQDVGRRRKSRGRKPNRHSQLIQPSYRLGAQQSPVSRRLAKGPPVAEATIQKIQADSDSRRHPQK